MSIKVENNNGVLSVVIPSEYKEPSWLGYMYMNRYTTREDGSIVIPCRECNVTITKPIIQQTSMGMMQTTQTIVERWMYFDVPQLSILVTEGDDLLTNWSLEKLGIELKEELPKPEETHNEESLNETI